MGTTSNAMAAALPANTAVGVPAMAANVVSAAFGIAPSPRPESEQWKASVTERYRLSTDPATTTYDNNPLSRGLRPSAGKG